jgi:predicted acylesterase/phospholipase RssA
MMTTAGSDGRARGFEIGLVMAGAVSAGAYTAGVVDFLIQALDQWQEGKRGVDPRCPRHDVSLKVMAGTSAGGMSAAIAAAQFGEAHTPAADPRPPGPSNNKLFESWVRRIDIARLLATSDLDADPDGDVRSLLDSTALDEIAAAVFHREDGPPPPERSYLADPLHILLTVTNLQSIPYEVRFLGEKDRAPRMSLHGDHLHFALGDAAGLGPEVRPLPPGRYEDPQ